LTTCVVRVGHQIARHGRSLADSGGKGGGEVGRGFIQVGIKRISGIKGIVWHIGMYCV
jgi:hypothetical protein